MFRLLREVPIGCALCTIAWNRSVIGCNLCRIHGASIVRRRDILLIGASLAIVGGAAAYGWRFFKDKFEEFNGVSREVLADVADNGWSKEAMLRHASPALKRWLDDPAHGGAFAPLQSFGKLRSFGGVSSFNENFSGASSSATLAADAEFAAGPSHVDMALSWVGSGWAVDSIHVQLTK